MKRISIICALALIFLGIRTTELFLNYSNWFKLRMVDISGNTELSEDEVLKLSGLRLERSIFNISLKEIAEKIEMDKRVKKVEVSRVLPGKVQINIEEKKPDLLVNSKYLPELYGISKEGEIIPLRDYYSYDLPLINGVRVRSFKPYSQAKAPEIQMALSFYKMVEEESPAFLEKISELNLEDENNLVVILVKSGAEIYFGTGDFKEKFKRFIWLKDKLNFEGYFSGMDFRFKDQIIFKGGNKSL